MADLTMKQKYRARKKEEYLKRKSSNVPRKLFSKSAYKNLKDLMRSEEKHLLHSEHSFPPKNIDGKKFYSAAYEKLKEINFTQKSEICLSCSVSIPSVAKPDLTIKSTRLNELIPHLKLVLSSNILDDHPARDLCNFEYANSELNGLMIDERGLTTKNGVQYASSCNECLDEIINSRVPKFALVNGFYNFLQHELPVLNWFEQQTISKVRFNNCIVKLSYIPGQDQRGFKGHMIAKAQKPEKIFKNDYPLLPEAVMENIHIILVSSRKEAQVVTRTMYKKLFSVRRQHILKWLIFLKRYNPDYADIEISDSNLQAYPENGTPECVHENVSETLDSILKDHASEIGVVQDENSYNIVIEGMEQLQKSLICDDNGDCMDLHEVYDALNDSNNSQSTDISEDTVIMINGSEIIKTNKQDFKFLAFPYIYPCGKLQPKRMKYVSFESEVQHLLIINETIKKNWSFQFFCYDLILKGQVFSGINYTISSMKEADQSSLAKFSIDDINQAISDRKKGTENNVMSTLQYYIGLAGGKAPFSQISKRVNRNEIKSFTIYQGGPCLYLTITPDDLKNVLSYIFCMKNPDQFDFESENLTDENFRAAQASYNPVSLAEFFNTIIKIIFAHLFGYENDKGEGIFGECTGYYGMVETQNRQTLHIHLLLWIRHNVNQLELFEKLKQDEKFRDEITEYLNEIISTDVNYADIECIPENNDKNKSQDCPACLLEEDMTRSTQYDPLLDPKDLEFLHKACHRIYDAVNTYQHHRHTLSCYKKGDKKCRYRKPEATFDATTWDEDIGKIFLEKHDGMVNNFNIWLTLLVNSNTDIQFLFNGNNSLEIIYYITNYITKNSVSIDNMYILQKAALEKTLKTPLNTSFAPKTFNKEQTHIRDFFIRFFNNLKQVFLFILIQTRLVKSVPLRLPLNY
jgi:peroxiredoxin